MKFKKIMAYALSASVVLSAGSSCLNVSGAGKPSGKGYKVHLKSATLEPGKSSSKKMSADNRYSKKEEGPYIVSFNGPITNKMKSEVKKLGVKFLDYTPEYSYLCYMSPDVAEKVKGISHVTDVFKYENEYKIDPVLKSKVTENKGKMFEKGFNIPSKELEVRISTFGIDDKNLISEIKNLGASDAYHDGNGFYAKVLPDEVEKLSTLKSVKFIEEVPVFKLNNNRAMGIVQSELASTFGYEGEGQIIGVADSGLDNGISGLTNGTIHKDFSGRIKKIIDKVGSDGADQNGHGTHVSGSIIGDGYMSQGKIKGMAPKASLIMQKIGLADGSVSPGNLQDLFGEAYNNGVRIHSDSWGNSGMGSYGAWSEDVDKFIWSHKDMLIVASAGNEGPDESSVGSPGSAKNCLTVGAVENFRPYMKMIKGSSISDDPTQTAFFSSRGCQDGRIKPDVVAPGTFIASTMSSSILPEILTTCTTYPGNSKYEFMNGTSMSTPIVSGSVAVIREYITKSSNITPSAALLKALVINGALGSEGYSKDKGWGQISLYNSMFGTQILNDTDSLSEGQKLTYTISCNRTDKPLKVTLVWSDYPGTAQNTASLVNDLNLKVISPDNTATYNGNDFTSPYNSDLDKVNNVENVYINNPVSGTYTIEVSGFSIVQGPQPFALVGSSDFLSTPKTVKATATNNSLTINWDPVPGATGYDIQVDGMDIVNVTGTSYTHSNLSYNSEHKYRVRAKDTRTYSVWSSTFTHSTGLNTPTLTSTFIDDGIQLSWNSVSQATSYEVYMNGVLLETTDKNTYTYNGLTSKAKYKFFVRAKSDFNNSDLSNILEISAPDIGISRKLSMTSPRMDFGMASSKNGKIYVAGGKNGSLYLNSLEEYDPSSNKWSTKKSMLYNRSGVRMVEGNNGKIYAIGGFDGTSYLNTVEEYNPLNDSWTTKTGMDTPRSDFGVACIGGKIYAIGGYNGSTLKSVEIYDPATDTWTEIGDMPTARSNFGTGVANGKITVMGGVCDTVNLKAVEEYDPSSGKWSVKNNLSDWNSDFSVSEVNGKLFISGGKNSNHITKYDPLTCSQVKAVELPSNVYGHVSTVQNGNLYIIGGFVDTSSSNQNLCYMPLKDGWVQEPSMMDVKAFFTAELINGKIYTIGGEDMNCVPVDTVEEYDIATGKWSSLPVLSEKKTYLASGVINSKIYVCGGDFTSYSKPYSNVLEVYDPVSKAWTIKKEMPEGLSMHKAVSLNGYLYVAGGYKRIKDSNGKFTSQHTNDVYKYDPASDSWSTVASMTIPRNNHGLVTLNGKIYTIGGSNTTGVLDSIEEYDPSTDKWTNKKPIPQKLSQFSTAVINNKIYVIGGSDFTKDMSSVFEYDPANETWTEKQSLPSVMARNCSVFDGNKIYTMGGMLDRLITVQVIDTMYSYSPSDQNIIKLDMGRGLMEPRSGKKTLPLSISNVPSKGIYKTDITLQYDPSTLSVTKVTPGNVITDSNAFTCTIDNTLGKINICFNGTNQPISNNGIYANVEFDVLESVNIAKSSPLSFNKEKSRVYGAGSSEYTGLDLINGAVDIFIYGDVNDNNKCDAIDFALMNKYLMGQIRNLPGNYSAISADVDASGVINAIDFALIRSYMLGNISKFPAQIQ